MNSCGTVSAFVLPRMPRTNSCCSAMYSRLIEVRTEIPAVEQFLDIFVALAVPAAWRVVVRQAVDQADLRTTREDRRHVDDRHASDVSRRNALERANHLRDFGRRIGLRGRDDDVLASLVAAPALVEQPERFSNARGIAEKDLQLSAVFRSLGRLDLPEQRFRVAVRRAIVVVNAHRRTIPEDDCI